MFPHLRDLTPKEAKAVLSDSCVVIRDLGHIAHRRLQYILDEHGVEHSSSVVDHSSYVIVREGGGGEQELHLNDDQLRDALVAMVLERGVPVRHVHVD